MFEEKSMEFLKDLLSKPGLPGYELPAQLSWRNYVKDYVDEVSIDNYYNSVAKLNTGGYPQIMLVAHIDQIGLMVNYIDDNGFIYLKKLGAYHPYTLLSREVYIMTMDHGNVPGIVGYPDDLYKHENNTLPLHKVWIDIGAKSVEEAKEKVKVGDYVVVKNDPVAFGNNRLGAAGIDDRIGCFAIAELMRRLSGKELKPAVFAVTSVQEEVNSLGAKLKSEELKPDIAIVVDIELCSDYPSIDKAKLHSVSLGKGPVISRGLCNNRFISHRLMKIAEDKGIPYQLYADNTSSGTDLLTVVKSSGALACVLGIPERYYHTPMELVDFEDVENAIKLLEEFIFSFNQNPENWDEGIKFD